LKNGKNIKNARIPLCNGPSATTLESIWGSVCGSTGTSGALVALLLSCECGKDTLFYILNE
jgi:hypothetical protein